MSRPFHPNATLPSPLEILQYAARAVRTLETRRTRGRPDLLSVLDIETDAQDFDGLGLLNRYRPEDVEAVALAAEHQELLDSEVQAARVQHDVLLELLRAHDQQRNTIVALIRSNAPLARVPLGEHEF